MARYRTLGEMLIKLRGEARLSLNPAHNTATRDPHVALLQRILEELWEDHDWPHLRVERLAPAQAGQRYLAPPTGMQVDRVERIEFRHGGEWRPLEPVIEAEHYSTYDSLLDERNWPVTNWKIAESENIEIWPVPSENADASTYEGYFKFTGIRDLRPFTADAHVCDLDDRVIVLLAAAELLAAAGGKDAGVKEAKARRRLLMLRGNMSPRKRFKLFGAGAAAPGRQLRGPPTVHYRVGG